MTKTDNPLYHKGREIGRKKTHTAIGEKKGMGGGGGGGSEREGKGREGGKGLDESHSTHRSG